MDALAQVSGDTGMTPDPAHTQRIAALFREYNRSLVAFLRSRLGSLADAQEVAQEAYVRLIATGRLEKIESLRAYLFHIASNLAIDRLRMRQVRADHPPEPPDEDLHLVPAPERRADAIGRLHALAGALRELPPHARRAFVMHVIEGRATSVIARDMKITERMVRYHVANAMAHCRAQMDEPETP